MLGLRHPTSGRRLAAGLKVLLAAGVAIVAAWVHPTPEFPYAFEVTLTLSVPSRVQLYYNRGLGFGEQESTFENAPAGTSQLRLPLPSGKFSVLRLDPLTRDGTVSFGNVRIVGPSGRFIRQLPASTFEPNTQIVEEATTSDLRTLSTTPGAIDPQLTVEFNPRLPLPMGIWEHLVSAPWTFMGWLCGILGVLIAFPKAWKRWRCRVLPLIDSARAHPRLSLALCALLATIASSYPVVFFGRSFVSPNNGAILLYDAVPTIPGVTDTQPEDRHGSDVCAMMWQHLPYAVLQSRALHEGSLPLWNRYASSGVALLGQGQSMFGDPLHFLVLAAGGASWAFDIRFLLAKALFACGVGWSVWMITRDLGAASLTVVAAAFIAFFNCRVNHPVIFSIGYAPWVMVGWLHLIQAMDRRALRTSLVVWFLANWCLITSGTVKEAYMLCLGLNLTGALAFLISPWTAGKIRRGVALTITAIAFLLVSAPVWWTFLDTLANAVTTYDAPRVFRIPRLWLIGVFDDIFYREFTLDYQVSMPAANLLVLIGCLCAFAQWRRLVATPAVIASCAGALVSLSLAFDWIPSSWILEAPFLRNIYHVNATFSTVAVVLLCIIAGWGFSAVRKPLTTGGTNRHVLLMSLCFTGLLAAYFSDDAHHIWSGNDAVTRWGPARYGPFAVQVLFIPFAAVILLWFTRQLLVKRKAGPWAMLIFVATLVILLARHGQHLPFAARSSYFAVPGVRADLTASSPAIDFLRDEIEKEPGRVLGTGNTLYAGFATVYGFEGINGPNALENRRYRELAEAARITAPGIWQFNAIHPHSLPGWRTLLDFLNVRYIGTLPGSMGAQVGFSRIASLDLDIYRSETTWPRAFFIERVERYSTVDELVSRLARNSPGQPFAAVQEENWESLPASLGMQQSSKLPDQAAAIPAYDYQLETNSTSFTVNASGPGLIVLHECWSPGDFRTSVNGQRVPWLPINHAFKGVVVNEAGEYRVSFTYWPRHFTAALVCCGIGLVLFGILLLRISPLKAGRIDGNPARIAAST